MSTRPEHPLSMRQRLGRTVATLAAGAAGLAGVAGLTGDTAHLPQASPSPLPASAPAHDTERWDVCRPGPGHAQDPRLDGFAPAEPRTTVDLGPLSGPEAYERALHRRDAEWSGGDLTSSIPLQDGRTLWLFGDTFLGSLGPDGSRGAWRMMRNTAMVQDGSRFTPLVGGSVEAPSDWIPRASADGWFWPGAGYVDGDTVKVFLQCVEPDATLWRTTGMALATLRGSDLQLLSLEPAPGDAHHLYGVAVAEDDTHRFHFGTGHEEGAFGKPLYVAREPKGRTGGAAGEAWEYWDGSAWQHRPERAQAVLPPVVSTQLSVSPYEGGFLAVSKKHEFLGTDAVAWWAPRPEGPWRELGPLVALPPPGPELVTYMSTAHPTQRLADGRLLVAWNVNSFDSELSLRDGDMYGPRFTAVPPPRP